MRSDHVSDHVSDVRARAKALRVDPKKAEQALWARIRDGRIAGLRFRRKAQVGPVIVDFLCQSPKLVIELDGGRRAARAADMRRDALIAGRGFHTLRFWNHEALLGVERLVSAIAAQAKTLRHHVDTVGRAPHRSSTSTGEGGAELLRAFSVTAEGASCDDSISLRYAERYRRRGRLVTENGAVFLLDLPEAAELKDGDALRLSDGRRVAIRAAAEPLADVRSDGLLARLAWHIGNRHTPCQVLPDRLLIQRDHVLEDMLSGLGAAIAHVEAPFQPEGGAYGHGRTHGHSHSHDPQADPNAHIPHRQG